MAHLSADKKEQFIQDMKPIENPNATEHAKSTVLAVMSWVTHPLTKISGAIAPSATKYVRSLMPATQDSHCKTQLKKLISETLNDLELKEPKQSSTPIENAAEQTILIEEQNSPVPAIATGATLKVEDKITVKEEPKDKVSNVTESTLKVENNTPIKKEELKDTISSAIASEQAKNNTPINKEEPKDKDSSNATDSEEKKQRVIKKEELQDNIPTSATEGKETKENPLPIKSEVKVNTTNLPDFKTTVPINLDAQMFKFFDFVEQFNAIAKKLNNRQKENSNYEKVAHVACNVVKNLEGAAIFFKNPTSESFAEFKEFCKANINQANNEFIHHRELWHTIHPILKGLLGVLAALTIIPALLVDAMAKEGYVDTFFKTPQTQSSKELSTIAPTYDRLEEEIEQSMKLGG